VAPGTTSGPAWQVTPGRGIQMGILKLTSELAAIAAQHRCPSKSGGPSGQSHCNNSMSLPIGITVTTGASTANKSVNQFFVEAMASSRVLET
jgi:hypothetical protein